LSLGMINGTDFTNIRLLAYFCVDNEM
jgi:hypothetical protein